MVTIHVWHIYMHKHFQMVTQDSIGYYWVNILNGSIQVCLYFKYSQKSNQCSITETHYKRINNQQYLASTGTCLWFANNQLQQTTNNCLYVTVWGDVDGVPTEMNKNIII